jgi:ATP-dependent Lon protease
VQVSGLDGFLGAPPPTPEEALAEDQVGVATGLAWTEAGGDVLFVEATSMRGKGSLILTGHLGEVMKESAKAALSYARATSTRWGIPKNFHKEKDIHIHVPSGAIPKDGPSAGITMLAAIISALTQRPVRSDAAMTGEITLRGRVLPVGGIREKILGAHRYDIRDVFLPDRNRKDISEIPSSLKRRMRLHFVNNVDEVLEKVLEHVPAAPKRLSCNLRGERIADTSTGVTAAQRFGITSVKGGDRS